jgi:hypothetical protein
VDTPERLAVRGRRCWLNDYPIRLTVIAEGTETAVIYDFPLKVGRDPTR